MNGGDKSPLGLPLDSKTRESRMNACARSSAADTITVSVQAPCMSAKALAARKGRLGGKQRREYLARLEQARPLLAAGLSNLEVAQRMGVAANSIPAFKRALGIEVVGYRKGTGRRAKAQS